MYTMQTVLLPQSICDILDKLNRNFLWGSTDDKGKVHLVNWDQVTRQKESGGLVYKRTATFRSAVFIKLEIS